MGYWSSLLFCIVPIFAEPPCVHLQVMSSVTKYVRIRYIFPGSTNREYAEKFCSEFLRVYKETHAIENVRRYDDGDACITNMEPYFADIKYDDKHDFPAIKNYVAVSIKFGLTEIYSGHLIKFLKSYCWTFSGGSDLIVKIANQVQIKDIPLDYIWFLYYDDYLDLTNIPYLEVHLCFYELKRKQYITLFLWYYKAYIILKLKMKSSQCNCLELIALANFLGWNNMLTADTLNSTTELMDWQERFAATCISTDRHKLLMFSWKPHILDQMKNPEVLEQIKGINNDARVAFFFDTQLLIVSDWNNKKTSWSLADVLNALFPKKGNNIIDRDVEALVEKAIAYNIPVSVYNQLLSFIQRDVLTYRTCGEILDVVFINAVPSPPTSIPGTMPKNYWGKNVNKFYLHLQQLIQLAKNPAKGQMNQFKADLGTVERIYYANSGKWTFESIKLMLKAAIESGKTMKQTIHCLYVAEVIENEINTVNLESDLQQFKSVDKTERLPNFRQKLFEGDLRFCEYPTNQYKDNKPLLALTFFETDERVILPVA